MSERTVFVANSRKDNKGRKLKDGESQRKDGRYSYRYTDIRTGKRNAIYASNLPKLREKEKLLEKDIEDRILTDRISKNMTLNILFERYMETCDIADSTRVNYIMIWNNRIRDEIEFIKVVNLVPSTIKAFYSRMARADYAHSTIKTMHNLIYPALELAVDDDIIRKNPAKGTLGDYGRKERERMALKLEQQNTLIEFVKNHSIYNQYYPMLVVMLGTGMRCGDADGKISLNQQKPSKHAGLRRFGPEKFLQRNNEFMKERPIFYKKPIKTEKDFSTWLRCFYYTTKAVITEYIYF